ncbi:MAG: Ig domain-containing protein [Betaproteobacteria bacterium]
MNILKMKTCLISSLIVVGAIGTAPAQTVSVNGSACPGATVTMGAGTISINTAGCGGGSQTVLPTVNATSPAPGIVATAYSQSFTASGTTPINWSSTGTLPPGLTFSTAGILSGTPTTAGTFSFSVIATNTGNSPAYQTAVTIAAQGTPPPAATAPTITSLSPPVGTLNAAYSYTFGANGTAPMTWTKATGTLPTGLTLSTSGVLSGTPTQSGTFPITVTATNFAGTATTPSVSIVVASGSSGAQSFGLVDINNNPIPQPVSKLARLIAQTHAGPNGGGNSGGAYNVNAWSVDTSKCKSTPAISTLWYHNIDLLDYGTQTGSDFIDFAPNQALAYAFTPGTPIVNNSQVGKIFMTQGGVGAPAASFMSISTSPCDFDTSKIAAADKCYSTGFNENGFTFQVTTNATSPVCKLTPGTRYYLNVRFQDARPAPAGTPTQDGCALQLTSHPGYGTCGGFLQIVTY